MQSIDSQKLIQKHSAEPDLDHLAWCAALNDAGLLFHSQKVANCNQDILFIETCSLDRNHYQKPIYKHCSDRAYCPDCAAATAKKNALITYNWLLENIAKHLSFNLYALRFDLTFPHEFDEISDEKIRALVARFMLELRGNDEGYIEGEELAYLYVIHRFGSDKNIFNRHLNIHIYALNAVLLNGKFKRTRPWANEERAKGIWGFIMQEELGWSEFAEKNPDLRVQYIPFYKVNDKHGRPLPTPFACAVGKHLITLRYMYRYPVTDVFKTLILNAPKKEKRSEGEIIQDLLFNAGKTGNRGGAERAPFMSNTSAVQSSTLREVLESHHRVTWCGYLASSRKTDAVKILTEKPIPLAQIIANLPHKTCPRCQSPLIPEWTAEEEGHSEAEDEAEFVQENDWGELMPEGDKKELDELDERQKRLVKEWAMNDALEAESRKQAYRARVNGW